jgi:ferredoxin-NADP reductase
VSRFLNSTQAPGSVVTLGEVEGEFTLPDPAPPKLLFLTAGSGITPVMAMLRALDRRQEVPDVAHIHSARTSAEAIFAGDLGGLKERYESYQYTLRETSTARAPAARAPRRGMSGLAAARDLRLRPRCDARGAEGAFRRGGAA